MGDHAEDELDRAYDEMCEEQLEGAVKQGVFMSEAKFTKGPWEQKPKQPTWFTVTLSPRFFSSTSLLMSAVISSALEERQPVPPQSTIWRFPSLPVNFALRQEAHFALVCLSSSKFLIISCLPP